MTVTIYFPHADIRLNNKIRSRFGIPLVGMNVNGEQVADIKDEDLPLLRETERLGFIQIRNKETN